MSFTLHENVQQITWIHEVKGEEEKNSHVFFPKVSGVCTSLLLVSKGRAPTLFSGLFDGLAHCQHVTM